MAEKKIGKVIHFYDKIGVAIIELSGNLNEGDKIRFEKDNESFEQEVRSMQIEHEKITKAKSGQAIGMKVDQPVKQNAIVFKI